jgi:hypothetical protein
VVNVLPQLHVTLISVYLGWVSIFMVLVPSVCLARGSTHGPAKPAGGESQGNQQLSANWRFMASCGAGAALQAPAQPIDSAVN